MAALAALPILLAPTAPAAAAQTEPLARTYHWTSIGVYSSLSTCKAEAASRVDGFYARNWLCQYTAVNNYVLLLQVSDDSGM